MDTAQASSIARWVTETGLTGTTEPELLRGFCDRLVAAGLPVGRANILIDTLHPIHEGRVFRWRRDDQGDLAPVIEYGRTNVEGEAADNWRRSTYYHLLRCGDDFLRQTDRPRRGRGFLRPRRTCARKARPTISP